MKRKWTITCRGAASGIGEFFTFGFCVTAASVGKVSNTEIMVDGVLIQVLDGIDIIRIRKGRL